MTVSAGTKTFKNLKLKNYKSDIAKTCPLFTTLTPFIYWKLTVSIKGRAHPKKTHQKYQEFIKILTLMSFKNSFFSCLQLYIYNKYIGNVGEEEGHYSPLPLMHGGMLLPSEPVQQYRCMNLPKTDKLMIMIEHIKMIQIPYLDIWSMLLSGQVPHRRN